MRPFKECVSAHGLCGSDALSTHYNDSDHGQYHYLPACSHGDGVPATQRAVQPPAGHDARLQAASAPAVRQRAAVADCSRHQQARGAHL